jgi:hypothetical protein
MPVRDWAQAMTTPATRNRGAADSLTWLQSYRSGLLESLAELGRAGERWSTKAERGEE